MCCFNIVNVGEHLRTVINHVSWVKVTNIYVILTDVLLFQRVIQLRETYTHGSIF